MGTGREVAEHASRARGRPPSWLRWLPLALLALALTLELTTPPRLSFAPLLISAVVLAALLYPPVVTVVVGTLSIILLLALRLSNENLFSRDPAGHLITLVLVTGLSALLALVRVRASRELVQVQEVAEAAQLALLRPLPERLGPLRLAGMYRAADAAALIGGDLYSVRPTAYGVRVLVGDVRGKGIGATRTMATITSAFREAAMSSSTLSELAARIETSMALDRSDAENGGYRRTPGAPAPAGSRDPHRDSEAELFATAVLMEFPAEGGSVRVLDRGHPPLYRIGGENGVAALEPAEYGLPLGLGDLSPDPGPEPRTIPLAAGETLVAYSDGVTEARGEDGTFYPLGQRLAERYGSGWHAVGIEPAEVVRFLQGDVARWAKALNDDMVVVVLQHDPPAAPHGVAP
ncbi:MAG: PP2C family protein-serine/threonine phosphatase [Streptomyces sp.]|uniref:PP2C family protein-serine/threonine phosphatase n=1 Tax=Streptomyces sp. TaxID=1931 RepID=UPI003D6A48B3